MASRLGVAAEMLGEAKHAVERGADFVAELGEEPTAGLGRVLRLGQRFGPAALRSFVGHRQQQEGHGDGVDLRLQQHDRGQGGVVAGIEGRRGEGRAHQVKRRVDGQQQQRGAAGTQRLDMTERQGDGDRVGAADRAGQRELRPSRGVERREPQRDQPHRDARCCHRRLCPHAGEATRGDPGHADAQQQHAAGEVGADNRRAGGDREQQPDGPAQHAQCPQRQRIEVPTRRPCDPEQAAAQRQGNGSGDEQRRLIHARHSARRGWLKCA
ncbi:MAG: hypothetical protein P4L71_14655 [Acetobacteraceae bacterium]|nr:hypothetical protein [Acetobacteraceae bacterium]